MAEQERVSLNALGTIDKAPRLMSSVHSEESEDARWSEQGFNLYVNSWALFQPQTTTFFFFFYK